MGRKASAVFCNSVLLKEFQTKVNGKSDCLFSKTGRIVSERLPGLERLTLRLMMEHYREERQKTMSKLGTLLAQLKEALLS